MLSANASSDREFMQILHASSSKRKSENDASGLSAKTM